MTRLHLSVFALTAALTGCGGAYEEGGGPNTPQVEYANANAQAETTASQDVYIGDSADVYYEDTDPTAVTEFRATLDPYGTWVEDDLYGTVWVPSATVVGGDFAPYVSAGHWSYGTDYVWVSDYDWGWAPFHYGRWVWIGARGWSWIPGRRYAGAWVTWRTGYDGWGYVGWAPLPPTWYWRGGYAYGIGWGISAPYVFCAHEHLFNPGVRSNIVGGAQVAAIGQHTRPYTPANPNVGVGGRNPANPTVGGLPTGGPPPGQLGINSAPVPPQNHPGLMKAQQYSTPGSAMAVGARAPQIGSAAHASLQSNAQPTYRSPSNGATYGGRSLGSTYTPGPRPYNPSQNGSVGQNGQVQQAPTFRNPQNMPQQLPRPSPSPQQSFTQTQPQYQPQVQPRYQPQYQPSPSPQPHVMQSQPQYSPSPQPRSFGGGSMGGGSVGSSMGGGGSVMGGGGGSFGGGRASPSVGGGGSFGGSMGSSGGSMGGGGRSMGGGSMGGGSMGGGGGGGGRMGGRR